MPQESGAVAKAVTPVAQATTGWNAAEIQAPGGVDFGAGLRAARETRGLALQDIADATRIRPAYLTAIEDMRLDQLPSRPFAIGYVRAYAQALGLDADQAVARFKDCAPCDGEPLRAPVGVRKHRDPRLSLAAVGAAVVVTAVLIWNLAQHAVAGDGPATPPVPVPAAAARPAALQGPVTLAAARPAPPDSDIPKAYITPGLGAPAEAVADAEPAGAPFSAQGAVYGAPAGQSAVTLQARKAASIIIRGSGGAVYFARQLAAGEAYRAPTQVQGLVVDVSDPQAFAVYMNGALQGRLQAGQTPLAKLAG